MSAPPAGSRVAVVTRTRNRNLLLGRAVASVLGQTHADWHLYIVNDGGDAEAVEATVAPHREAFAGRLTVIHNPVSLGMEAASNRALVMAQAQTHATGDFLVVHDDDDAWHPDFLKETVGFLQREENRRYAAVLTRMTRVYERLEPDRVVELYREPWHDWQPHLDGLQLLSRNLFCPIAFVIRMSVVRQIGFYNDTLPVIGDWDYNLRVFAVGDIGTIDQPLAYYHLRPEATGSYGNSVEAGRALHARYNVLYRNALLRTHLNADPGAGGSIMTLLHVIADYREMVRQRLDAIETPLLARLQEIAEGQAVLSGTVAAEGPVMAALHELAQTQAANAARLDALVSLTERLAEGQRRQEQAQARLAQRLDEVQGRLGKLGFRAWWKRRWRRLGGR
ncbi:glycosyltransferase [Ancylobacter sp. Lp-2]|uniref:glycosyltransferase family 2 protein n=1 Tax=Ancylobacter sp. Lp-2 TaxID=2881339 RepID=UPI001E5771E9|nr:glycosyltransferase family 2 protein [Ancylobacter sp. Lp-2]MCB4769144.1 glycosyltransferase [Ancylobacter sp. Lp-2]